MSVKRKLIIKSNQIKSNRHLQITSFIQSWSARGQKLCILIYLQTALKGTRNILLAVGNYRERGLILRITHGSVIPCQLTECFPSTIFNFFWIFHWMLPHVFKEAVQNYSSLHQMVGAPGPPVWTALSSTAKLVLSLSSLRSYCYTSKLDELLIFCILGHFSMENAKMLWVKQDPWIHVATFCENLVKLHFALLNFLLCFFIIEKIPIMIPLKCPNSFKNNF